jgi:hypothetical protein
VRLILNADDLGYSPGVSRAILALIRAGRVTSTSVPVNLLHSLDAMEAVGGCEGLGVGVHLNLTRGTPCLAPARVPTPSNGRGGFGSAPGLFSRALAGRISQAEAAAELCAQIETAAARGISVAHRDSHSHWHTLPRMASLVRNLAKEYHIPRVRVSDPRRAPAISAAWLAAATGSRIHPERGF